MRFTTKEGFNHFLDLRHTGHTADQHHFINFTSLQASVLESCFTWLNRALNEIIDQTFKLGTRQFDCKVLWTSLICGDERQVDFGLLCRRQFDLGLFSSFFEALQSKLIVFQVNALFLLELGNKIFDQTHVEVFTAKESVTIGRLHFKDAITDFEDRNVK